MTDNADLARSLYDGWNARDFDRMAEAMAPDGKLIDVGSGEELIGPEGARQYNEGWARAFPDGVITINRVLDGGDVVVVEYTGRGTNTGDLPMPSGSIPATGRSVTMEFCDVTEFKDGKVTVQRSYYDSGSMMAQLGLAEQSTTAPG